jgi:vancomycin resistance protein YoaR
MSSYTATHQPTRQSLPFFFQAILVLVLGMALFFVFIGAAVIGYDFLYAGKIFPGISVAGVDISGLSPEEAAGRLGARLVYPTNGKIVFQDGANVWVARPVDVGLYLDSDTSVQAAYALGRSGSIFSRLGAQFDAWYFGTDLPPLLVYDEKIARGFAAGIASQIDRPTVEASLEVTGTNVIVKPGQVGRTLDINATLAPLEAQLRSLTDGILPVMIDESTPAILDASQQAEIARKILSAPLVLQLPDAAEGDPGPWTFKQDQLAAMLSIERVEAVDGAHYQVGLNPDSLQAFLESLKPRLARSPQNARFIFNDDTRQLDPLEPAIIGRSLDVEATIQAINDGLAKGQHNLQVSLQYTQPAVADSATAAELGITELVSSQTSYFYGSSGSRIQNIEIASSRFHGLMVAPGATFSMAEVLGDVSLDNGYAEALIIYGNRTIKGVGGGVCQVSTTLFRTAFFGGFPVAERHPHAYRVYYYELNAANQVNTSLAGLDATVYVPVVDFKFTNDTPNWLLMETYVNAAARSLTWKFYSTSDGRTMEWDSTGLQNIVDPPEPVYQENPDLAKNEVKQVDWGVAGADVSVTRTVMRDGQVYFTDTFNTHYLPWADVYEYGPGTKLEKIKKDD